jgi:hypothetical protein
MKIPLPAHHVWDEPAQHVSDAGEEEQDEE